MRTRTVLLVVLVGSVAAGTGAAQFGPGPFDAARLAAITGQPALSAATLTRVDFSDAPALVASARSRNALDRDGERRLDAFALLAGIALLVLAAWWAAVRRRAGYQLVPVHVGALPRAPPTLPALVSS